MTHICVCKFTIIGSDNGLPPGRRQAMIWTNAGILLIWPLGTNFGEIFIGMKMFEENALENVICQMASICLGLNVLSSGNVFACLLSTKPWPEPAVTMKSDYGCGKEFINRNISYEM